MPRKRGRSSLLRRLEELEARSTDSSRFVPHSPEWLAYWQSQLDLFNKGERYVPLTIEALRAIMRATPDEDEVADSEMASVAGTKIATDNRA